MKVSAHLRIHQHRGALVDDVEHFDPMLPLANTRQVVQERFGSWRAPQALGRFVAHLEDAVDDGLAEALGRVLARP
jgi:hypothetical protein